MGSRWSRVVGCAALALACDAAPPVPELRAVVPARGFTDRRLRLSLQGDGFLPSYQLDLESGRRLGETAGFVGRLGDGSLWVPLTGFGWKSAGELTAWLEPAPG